MSTMRTKFSIAALATALALMALPAAAFATEGPAGVASPPDSGPVISGDQGEETPPTWTPEPPDRDQSGLPAIPAECVQEDGSYLCPDGLPPYGCWAVPAPNDPDFKVGLCICPPEVPINLCDWEPMSCEGPIDPPALPSCTLGEDDNPICSTVIPLTRRDGTVRPKPKSKAKQKARARTHSGHKAKPHGTKKLKATKKHAAKKPASKKSPRIAKKKHKAAKKPAAKKPILLPAPARGNDGKAPGGGTSGVVFS